MAVVAVHTFVKTPFVVKGIEYDPSGNPVTMATLNFVDKFVADFSVPTFFFVSGYLFFAGGMSGEIYKKKLKRRARSLLAPYIIWNILAVLFAAMLFLPVFSKIFPSLQGESFHMTLREFINGFTIGTNADSSPHAGNLWFVRELMTVILLSPLINLLIDKAGGYLLSVFYLIWAYVFITQPSMYLQFLTSALLFFSSGAYFAKNEIDPSSFFKKYWKLTLAIFLVLEIWSLFLGESTTLPVRIIKIITVPCALSLVFYIGGLWGQSKLRNRILGEAPLANLIPGVAFFIFVAHGIILFHVKVLAFYIVQPTGDLSFLAAFLLTYFGVIILLIGLYILLGKISPALQQLLSGRYSVHKGN